MTGRARHLRSAPLREEVYLITANYCNDRPFARKGSTAPPSCCSDGFPFRTLACQWRVRLTCNNYTVSLFRLFALLPLVTVGCSLATSPQSNLCFILYLLYLRDITTNQPRILYYLELLTHKPHSNAIEKVLLRSLVSNPFCKGDKCKITVVNLL